MTTPEHTLVGMHLAFAAGVYRVYGWRAVVLAALASNVPDWDGLPMLVDMQRFEAGHRVWGHNVLAIVASSLLLTLAQATFDWIGMLGTWANKRLSRLLNQPTVVDPPGARQAVPALMAIATVAQLVHLPCDMVVSGGNGLTDWPVKPWWPFSDTAFVFPLIPWGDPGPTIILMAGAILIARWPGHLLVASKLTLIALCLYLGVRGWSSGHI